MNEYIIESGKKYRIHPIFIITSFTNTMFGKVITTYTHSQYSHAAISLDPTLEHMYSFNADNKNNVLGGVSIESIKEYIQQYKDTLIKVNCIFVKEKDFKNVKSILDNMVNNIKKTTYGYTNLFSILFHRAKNATQEQFSMVCSQFVSWVIKMADIDLINKASNLVTPKDLADLDNPKVYKIYEGKAVDYDSKTIEKMIKIIKVKALLIKENFKIA